MPGRRQSKQSGKVYARLVAAVGIGIGSWNSSAHGDVTATWTGGSGNWTTAADWSTNPNYPNNGTPSGTDYQAVFTRPGSGAYTVTENSSVAVDSLAIGSPNATVSDTSTLTIGSASITSGTFQLAGGTLSGGASGATITLASPSQFKITGGTLNDLTFAGSNLNFNQFGELNITGGLDLSGNSLNLGNFAMVEFAGNQTIDQLSIDGTTSSASYLYFLDTLTLGANAIVHGNLVVGGSSANSILVNNGLINADTASRTLAIIGGTFTNNSTAEATNGGMLSIGAANWNNQVGGTISAVASTLSLSGSWTNSGTISTSGASTVSLGGTFTLAGLGAYSPSAGTTTNITGTLNNSGQTLTLMGETGTWNLSGGTVSGGTVCFGNNLNIIDGTLSGVTIASGATIAVPSGGVLTLSQNWSNSGAITAAGASTINLGGTFTLATLGSYSPSPNTVTNISGLLLNSGTTLTLPSGSGTWGLNGGTISGGSIALSSNFDVAGNSTLDGVQFSGGNLNVTGAGANIYLQNGFGITGGGINLIGAGSHLYLDGPSQTVNGYAIEGIATTTFSTLDVGGPTSSGAVTVTLGPSALVHGAINIGDNPAVSGNTLINNGTIQADFDLQPVSIVVSNFVNNNFIQTTNGGSLSITSANWTNSSTGTISVNGTTLSMAGNWTNSGIITTSGAATVNLGGTFTFPILGNYTPSNTTTTYITGTLNNGGGTLAVNGSNGTWGLKGGTINGGSIAISNASDFNLEYGTFNGVTISGANLTVGQTLTVENGITLTGGSNQINLTADYDELSFLGPNSSIDHVTIYAQPGVNHYFGFYAQSGSSTLTLGPNAVLTGQLEISDGTTGDLLINNGMISSNTGDSAGVQFENQGNIINNGTISATNGGSIAISAAANPLAASVTNNGTMTCVGSTFFAQSQQMVNNAQILVSAGGNLGLGGTWTNAVDGTISATGGSTLSLSGTFTNSGTIILNNSTLDVVSSNLTVAALGSIAATNSSINVTGTFNMAPSDTLVVTGNNTFNLGNGNAPGGPSETTINGGNLSFTNGASFHVAEEQATLNGINVQGSDVNIDACEFLTISNGITIATHNLNFNNYASAVTLVNTNALNNLIINNFSGGSDSFMIDGTNPVLTLSSTSTMNGSCYITNGYDSSNNSNHATFVNDGTMNITNSVLNDQCSYFVNNGLINDYTGFQFVNGFTNNGVINLKGGGITVGYLLGGFPVGSGTLTGTGDVADGLAMNSSIGTLLFHIGGTAAGNSYDQITVGDGNVSLGGNLEIVFVSGFQSSITSSEEFIVLTDPGGDGVPAGSVIGSFANVANGGRLETADGYGSFQVNYGSGAYLHDVVLSDFQATVEPWTNASGNGLWDTDVSANWNVNGSPSVFNTGDNVTFDDSSNGNYGVMLNATVSPGSVVVNNSLGDYSISGSGSIAGLGGLFKFGTRALTLNTVNTYSGGTTVNAGTLIAGVAGALPNGNVTISGGTLMLGAGTGVAHMTSLAISGSGVLDVTNNEILISYGPANDPIGSIAAWIANGYNGGTWNGAGIISSTAQSPTNGLRYGIGWADGADGIVSGLSSGQIEMKYTLLGDANLDGVVNGSDFSILAANFGQGYTNWDQGNFLFTPAVNGADFAALAANFGQGDSGGSMTVSQSDIAALDSFAIANGLPLPTIGAVPEPAAGAMAVVVAAGGLARRRKRFMRIERRSPTIGVLNS